MFVLYFIITIIIAISSVFYQTNKWHRCGNRSWTSNLKPTSGQVECSKISKGVEQEDHADAQELIRTAES